MKLTIPNSLMTRQNLIGGQWRASVGGAKLGVVSPQTGAVIGSAPRSNVPPIPSTGSSWPHSNPARPGTRAKRACSRASR